LRYVSTLDAIPRVALARFEVGGSRIEPGALVWLVTDTANHDATGYADPGRFDPQRFDRDDAPRLMTFGAGPHFGLGAVFARVVVQGDLPRTAPGAVRTAGRGPRLISRSPRRATGDQE
jgi:cytochrome P450